ncbi:MAG TPA: aminotransferase class IV [Candidatus Saccharimonadales bacterium]|nr:aminotransferase class IV [Candidatus Saccharimonadales bacterium]
MTYRYFSANGQVLPTDQALVPLDSIAYSYGFGVYETIRVNDGAVYFLPQHLARLMTSANAIDLAHNFNSDFLQKAINDLVEANKAETCNLKILLIGGNSADDAQLFIQCLNPLFPDRKLYTSGAHAITENYVRRWPQAKTLNMLPSYLAYRRAQQEGAYDALLVDHEGCIREGTRTNFFVIKGKTITSPPASKILPGVMREAVLKVARENGYRVEERDIKLADLKDFEGAFVTSTSSKVLPLSSIDEHGFGQPSADLKNLMQLTNDFLANCGGKI